MIARENITVIFTHHHRKKSMFAKNDDSESSRGSSAINAAISGHLSLEEVNDKEGEKYLVLKHLKSKVGEKLQPFDIGIQTGDIVSFQYLGEHKPKEQALTEATTKILNELQRSDNLMSRKDFVYLGIGGMTTIKDALKWKHKSNPKKGSGKIW
jgi:RecA-family ATPase